MGITKPLGQLGLFLSAVLFLGCNPEPNEALVDYVIINDSGVALQIIAENPSNEFSTNEKKSPLNIEEGATYSERIFIDGESSFAFSTFFGTDNVTVYFNNERSIFFNCLSNGADSNCSDARNILKFIPDANNRAEYTFTESDFNHATPCDGPCN